jgi:RNA polymerase sigma-70 factor (ECF subfamily)
MSDLDVHLPLIAAGDPDAFARWVAGCEFRLRSSLSSFAARVDVEAVMQETLLRVWQVAPRVEPDGRPDSLLRFAIRVARNLAVSEHRRLTREPPPEVAETELALEPDPLLRRLVEECRDKLPPKPALALIQRLESGGVLSDRELAARAGMQLNTFLQNFGRARKLLAECLERQGVQLEAP